MDVPGITAEQAWVYDTIAERAARKVLAEYNAAPCTAACPRVEEVRDTVYGNGSDGLKTAVTRLQKDVGSLVWWYRILVAAVVSSWLTLLYSFVG
jgi:hypothetical protein